MSRAWFLTWTTYGTWLPGDPRGSVTSVRDGDGPRVEHDLPDTEYDGPMPGLRASAESLLKGPPVYLDVEQAAAVLAQFRETAGYRGWNLRGAAVMANHLHIVVRVPGDPEPGLLVKDFKSWATRKLDRGWGKPPVRWWADGGGSKRKLPDERAVAARVTYVRKQYQPLAMWIPDDADDGAGGVCFPDQQTDPLGAAGRINRPGEPGDVRGEPGDVRPPEG